MRTTDTALNVIEQRGKQGKPLERLYRQLYKRELYETAYSEIYANPGATTPGINNVTLDGMSNERIDDIIQRVKKETYKWNPVRRTHIPKSDGKSRPLGIPTGDDKLLQTAMKILLEAFYEPQFSEHSHGFRSGRGCHTALRHIDQKHRGTAWFIEGDIKGCFDNIDHEILLEIMGEKIKDGRMLKLISNLLKAGYLEDWKNYKTLSGTPQGGIISPLLTNIYLDKFDQWVEKSLMPQYNRSQRARVGKRNNPEYMRLYRRAKKASNQGDKKLAKAHRRQARKLPSVMVDDEGYRKLAYVRYADDFLLSFTGPKREAEEIKKLVSAFMAEELKLTLSSEKTLITHAKTQKARFLGYDLRVRQSNHRKSANGGMWFGIPREVITKAMQRYTKNGKPHQRPELMVRSDYEIIKTYQDQYRGVAQYYVMAHNYSRMGKLNGAMRASLIKTLASKHKTTFMKIVRKYKTRKEAYGKTYKVIQTSVQREGKKPLVTHYGAVPLVRDARPSKITDFDSRQRFNRKSDLLTRMNAEECEMCGQTGYVEVHHVRKLKDVNKPGRKAKPAWAHRIAALKRKTLIVCKECHVAIHNGTHRQEWNAQ